MMNLQPADIQELVANSDINAIADYLSVSMSQDAKDYVVADKPQLPFHEWVKSVTLDGHQFTYDCHEYLLESYQVFHSHQIGIKFTQMINRRVVKSDDLKIRTSCPSSI